MKRISPWGLLLLACWAVSAPAGEIGYVEDFALASDRAVALKQLIPGTEDFYYYHCLYYQNQQQYDRVEQLLQAWIQRYNYTPRVREIQNRQALLTYSASPQQSLDYLQRTLQLQFNHQREVVGAHPDLPSTLDAALISREALWQRALQEYQNLEGVEDAAFDWLIEKELPADRRHNLLERLSRPDYPQLAQLIVDDLNQPGSGGFGSLPIHSQLLLAQLDECLQLKPDLLNQSQFIQTYLTRLQPNDDIDLRRDVNARQAYLERLWSFVERLAPAHNSLKAHVLFHRLLFDREQGNYDKTRFMTYLALPRVVGYINPRYLEQPAASGFAADLNADYSTATRMPAIVDDEPLVRSYLQYFFLTETTYKPYEQFLDDTYVKRIFAETKIVNGLGDSEQWSAMLPPEQFQELKQRVDLDFAYTNRQFFDGEEPVRLDLAVKNVTTLIVKVYEINTFNYYRQNQREVNTDVNLDGLVANHEETYQYDEPPLRRMARHFEFPTLTKPGVYVIDFIGNGKSSRAVIRKGQLQYLSRTTAAGYVFTILNERNELLPHASLWLDGHAYQAGPDGTIAVPFSTNPGVQPIILSHNSLSSLDSFRHDAENYQLVAGIYVDRESLLSHKTAKVLVRSALYLNGTPVSLSLLEHVRLMISATDLDGVASSKEVADFPLWEDRESVYDFQVPERLAQLQFTLTAKVQNISQNQPIELAASSAFQLNGIDKTDKIEDLHLLSAGTDYVVELLGKTGEPQPDHPVRLSIKHRDFRQPVDVTLRTDAQGQVMLGALDDIEWLTATGPADTSRTWPLRKAQHSHYQTLHAAEGTDVTVPYMGPADQPLRDELSLLELRGDSFVADRFDAMKLTGGMLVISGLSRGDYDLLLKRTQQRIRLKIAAGQTAAGYVLGPRRQLELRANQPLQIQPLTLDDGRLQIQLINSDKFARVHVFATRYEPAYGVYSHLGTSQDRELAAVLRGSYESMYTSGRRLGDEYRYIIDRKYATKYPGNMLERPSLLLNPWAVRSTQTDVQSAAEGDEFAAEPAPAESARDPEERSAATAAEAADSPNLDFLANGSAVLVNLVPDEQGRIAVEPDQLAPYQRVWVVAVHPLGTAARTLSLPPAPRKFVDLRLHNGLNPQEHFTQQKLISIVGQNQTLTLNDISTSRFDSYDSLAKVHALMMTLSGNATLVEFNFILNWDQLTPEQKREKYSKYACHELHLFLYHKDRPFFDEVILPYLQNKKDKTFVDHWLLSDDLRSYLTPWHYAQLNTTERILLADRIPDEMAVMRRLIGDQFALLPPNTDRFNFLFNTAVQGSVLSTEEGLAENFARAKADATAAKSLELLDNGITDSGTLNGPAGMGGMGGRGGGAAFGAAGIPPAPAPEAPQAELAELAAKPADAMAADMPARDRAEDKSRLMTEEKDSAGELEYWDDAQLGRKLVRRLYQQMDKTQEWAEENYYHLPIEQQNAGLIQVNAFWHDYAQRDRDQKFLSTHFAEATSSFSEMMLALAVLDLPLQSVDHDVTIQPPQMVLVAKSPLVVFHEEIRGATPTESDTPILVSQNFFRHGDRFRYVDNQKLDKYVTDEFLIQSVYGCQVVVTNPTSAPQKLDLLLQIPEGALPVLGGKETRSVHIDLEPFHTATYEYYFYFPLPGDFAHYPVHVAHNEQLLTFAEPAEIHVVREPTQVDRQSWEYVSQNGTPEEVVNFLKTENLQRIDLEKIAFRMHDKSFFQEVTQLLATNHIFHPTLWSYAIKHDVPQKIGQFLQHQDAFVRECGLVLDSPLLKIDPIERNMYQHLDYKPLVNARAHRLGERRQIVNDRLLQQYQQLLTLLTYEPQMSDQQLMAVTYYLLLQDRIEEALSFFHRVDPEHLPTRLQYDYFTAYLDFYNETPQLAGPLATKYAAYPVDRWREAFAAIAQQLAEIAGGANSVVDEKDRQQSQTQLAATEPGFDFQVEARQIRLNYQNLTHVRVNYYLMDIELLFSRNPFVQQYSGQFSTIQPNLSVEVELPQDKSSHQLDLPESLLNSNVLVEIEGGGNTRSQAYYANSLDVQVVENYGQLRVVEQGSGRPLSTVYVKVYAQMNDGSIRFYKDGYTDLRGRFDYTSLNTNELDAVTRFSLLILSPQQGAVVREANPPKR